MLVSLSPLAVRLERLSGVGERLLAADRLCFGFRSRALFSMGFVDMTKTKILQIETKHHLSLNIQ